MSAAIEFDRVTIHRGGRAALTGISLQFSTGSLTAVLGPNGAGKSTLLRAINGELPAAAGALRVLGEPVGSLGWRAAARLRRRIGVMPQAVDQLPAVPLTVREVVELGRVAHGRPGAALDVPSRRLAAAWMERFGLGPLANRSMAALSGGEQRKTHLARIFAQEPELILLDEPAGHLDLPAQDALTRLIAEVWRETRATVVIVTHELRHLPSDTSDVVLLAKGKVRAAGPVATHLTSAALSEVFEEPLEVVRRHGRYAALLAAEGGAHGGT
jgi:iron complex transport system ATP-binding protein